MICYLYELLFENGKRYIGISYQPKKRFREHCREAVRNSQLPVHCAMRVMKVEQNILVSGARDYIVDLEVMAIAIYRTVDRNCGYNVTSGGETCPMWGMRHTEKTKAKMRASHKGKPKSPEWAAKIGASRRGKFWNKEQRANGSEAQKKRVRTTEEIARMTVIAQIAGANRRAAKLARLAAQELAA